MKPFFFFFICLLLGACSGNSNQEGTILSIDHVGGRKENAGSRRSDSLKHVMYTHVYDTIKHDKYAYRPDSLYALLLLSETTEKWDAWKQMKASVAGKYFLAKMKEMKDHQKLVKQYGFPSNAQIDEIKILGGIPHRMLVLWLKDPYVAMDLEENGYTCPEYTQGKCYFEGEAFVSLLDSKRKKIINSVPIQLQEYTRIDTVQSTVHHTTLWDTQIPISILKRSRSRGAMGGKYYSIHGTDSTDGKAEILHLEDFNLDGRAHEFAMFKNFACAGTTSTLYGYSIVQDKVIHYPIHYRIHEPVWNDTIVVKDTSYETTGFVIEGLFTQAPHLFPFSFAIDSRGRGGCLNRYKVYYDTTTETFNVERDATIHKGDERIRYSWVPAMVY